MVSSPRMLSDFIYASLPHTQWGSFMAVVLLSYLLEDGALLLAAGLALAGILPSPLAWAATFVGIFTGDIGLFYMARWVRKPFTSSLRSRPAPNVTDLVVSRFTPGLRTVVLAWSGASQMPFSRFFSITFWSALIWTLLAFSLIYQFGGYVHEWLGLYKWVAFLVVLSYLSWRYVKGIQAAKLHQDFHS